VTRSPVSETRHPLRPPSATAAHGGRTSQLAPVSYAGRLLVARVTIFKGVVIDASRCWRCDGAWRWVCGCLSLGGSRR